MLKLRWAAPGTVAEHTPARVVHDIIGDLTIRKRFLVTFDIQHVHTHTKLEDGPRMQPKAAAKQVKVVNMQADRRVKSQRCVCICVCVCEYL